MGHPRSTNQLNRGGHADGGAVSSNDGTEPVLRDVEVLRVRNTGDCRAERQQRRAGTPYRIPCPFFFRREPDVFPRGISGSIREENPGRGGRHADSAKPPPNLRTPLQSGAGTASGTLRCQGRMLYDGNCPERIGT